MAAKGRRNTLLTTVAPELEQQLVQASSDGDLEGCAAAVLDLQTRHDLTAEPVEELLGYAFSCSAAHSRLGVMDFLLHGTESETGVCASPAIRKCLLHGVCRDERFFPRRPRFQCCFALRYLAFASVVCVEQNALPALEFLVQRPENPASSALLVDLDVLRCFRFALERGSNFHAPAPEVYRPMLMLLLRRYPALLLPLVDGKHEIEKDADDTTRQHMEALRSSLLYEYTTNPQLQTKTSEP